MKDIQAYLSILCLLFVYVDLIIFSINKEKVNYVRQYLWICITRQMMY